MITVEDACKIHLVLSERFGGATGIRDLSLLESALSRPFQTFDGTIYINLQLRKRLP
jgi:death-on-curing protein